MLNEIEIWNFGVFFLCVDYIKAPCS